MMNPCTTAPPLLLPWLRLAALTVALLAPAAGAAPFTDHGNGTATDAATSLMWDRCYLGQAAVHCDAAVTPAAYNWQTALQKVAALNAQPGGYKGYTDWRLPNKNELESLVDTSAMLPSIDGTVFPGTPSAPFWSSSSYAASPSLAAWLVLFGTGEVITASTSNPGYYVRLVRSGQPVASFDAHADTTAPMVTLTSVTPTATTASASMAVDEAATGWRLLRPATDPAPAAAAVKATGTATGALAANVAQPISLASLTPATAYVLYAVAEDASGNLSVVQSQPFTTLAVHAVTATASPAVGGSASCPGSPVTNGGTATCTATANANYQFSAWTGACAGQGAACMLNGVTSAQTSVALFTQQFAGLTLPEGQQTGQPLGLALPSGNGWQITQASTQTTASLNAPALPSGVVLPHGVLRLRLEQGAQGSAATVVLTYPQPLPPGARYYKYGRTQGNPQLHWYEFTGAQISGNTVTLQLQDGGAGDDDLAANSAIDDPGGVAMQQAVPAGAQTIPTLGEWALVLLAGLLGFCSLGELRGREKGVGKLGN